MVFSNNAFDKWLNDLLGISNTILHAVGVAHVSLSILNRMGFKNIGFLGLDHSFKGNNFAKSSGTSSNKTLEHRRITEMAFKECWYSNYKPKFINL